jgi:signal transduction histidine kinase
MTDKPKILIVDDKPENLFALSRLLQALDVEVGQALSGVEALNLTLEHDFCVAIVDIQMPELDGYELVELLRSNKVTAALPVIFVSAIYSDEYHHRKGYEAGAVDFLSKPFVPEILLSKVKVFIDLYQQRQALEKANLALARLNADKDRFFSIISHDLRGPFNPVLGNAQLLAASVDKLSPQDIRDMSQAIHRGAKAVFNLLNSLLTWARLQQEGGMHCSPEPIALKLLANDTLAVLQQAAAQKQIGLANTVPFDCWVQADRVMLETIIRNLVSNALKFTPRGGQVTLTSLNGASGQPGFVKISVQDTGVGMSPDDVARLFKIDSSHSTPGTEKEPGSGLGLIICKEMVERNGGRIWVESGVGQGTTVEFTLPLAPALSLNGQEAVS